jgi:uncharacterized protein YxjI
MALTDELLTLPRLIVRQRFEGFELLGYETRNKYAITDESGRVVGFAAEQQKGIWGFLLRQFLGHWRRFSLDIFDGNRQIAFHTEHPFRFFFQRLEIYDTNHSLVGALQQRFSFLTKSFDVEDGRGNAILTVRSPLWKLWTFPFLRGEREVAVVRKKWGGLLAEGFTDKDTFAVEYTSHIEDGTERALILAAALFIDLQYFENKAGRR